jgi:hypothetical protein
VEAIGQTSGQLESLMSYCTLVRQRLQTFDGREKRLTLEALDIRVTWTPNEPLAIQGSSPLRDIVPVPSGCAIRPQRLSPPGYEGPRCRPSRAIGISSRPVMP